MTSKISAAIDLADPDWTDAPERIVARLAETIDGPIRVDASRAGQVLAPTAQILLSARMSAQARGADLVLMNASQACRGSLAALGLADDVFQHEEA